MTGMTPERLASIEDRLPGMIRPGTTEHDALDLIDEVRRLRAKNDNLRAGAKSFVRQFDRLTNGIEALTRTGYDHTPECVREREKATTVEESSWHPDCGRCWQDSLHKLLYPTEGETDGPA